MGSIFDYFFLENYKKIFADLTIWFTISQHMPKFVEKCCAHIVSCKSSSNCYHFFTIATYIFENRLFFAGFFSVCVMMHITDKS